VARHIKSEVERRALPENGGRERFRRLTERQQRPGTAEAVGCGCSCRTADYWENDGYGRDLWLGTRTEIDKHCPYHGQEG
jgi:hypothetical protein